MPQCKRLGLLAIITPKAGQGPSKKRQWPKLSDAEVDTYVKSLVGDTANDPTVLGYFILDEPVTRDFAALAKAVAAVKKYALGKLAYINLFPTSVKGRLGTKSYEQYLERFIQEVKPQLISYDNYTVMHSDDMQNAKAISGYYRNLLQIRAAALKHKLPYWNIVCSQEIRPKTTVPTPANLALQAYTSLAGGFAESVGTSSFTMAASTAIRPSTAPATAQTPGSICKWSTGNCRAWAR